MPNYAVQRQYQRYSLSLPVDLDGMPGITRDVSVGGVYFEAAVAGIACGTVIHFSLLLPQEGGMPLRLDCEGTVVRLEPAEGGYGIAARIDGLKLDAAFRSDPFPSRSSRAPRDH